MGGSRAYAGDGAPPAPPNEPLAQPATEGSKPSERANEATALGEEKTAREQARNLGYAGVRAYAAGDYVGASQQLEQSFALLPVPSLGLWSARALVKLQRFVDAEQRYREVAKMRVEADAPAVQHAALETAKAELVELLPRIPSLRVQIAEADPEQVTITVDGIALPREHWSRGEPVDPGAHHVVGSHLGQQSVLDITAIEGRESEVLIRFGPPEPTPTEVPSPAATTVAANIPAAPLMDAGRSPHPLKLGGWLAVGAGAAGLALGTASYLVARGEYRDMKQDGTCDGHICKDSPRLDHYQSWRSVEIASLVAGGVLTAGGVTVLLLERRLSQAESDAAGGEVSLRVGPSSVSLAGRF